MRDWQDLAESLLDAATAAGADAADALVNSGQSVSVEVRNAKLEQADRSEGTEIGLRVLVGPRQAVVSGSDTSARAVSEMAERAVAMAREAPEDPTCGLADQSQLASLGERDDLDLVSAERPPTPEELQAWALEVEAAAQGISGVAMVDGAEASWGAGESIIAATNGFRGTKARTSYSLGCIAISGTGLEMERDYCFENRVHREDMPDAREVGRTAGERAVARNGARKPESGTYPVLFDERVSGSLVGHLLSAINGSMVVRGSSWLIDALDTDILPPDYSLVERPHRPRIFGSSRFDAEGLGTEERRIVDAGVLRSWTLDLGTARKLGCESTANAARGVGGPPSPSAGNVVLEGPEHPRQSLLEQMGTGLVVTSLMGRAINPTTGDYSRGASGFWVENGEISVPVHECTIAGNLRQMLLSILAADDARPHRSNLVPSLLVDGLTIAGD